MNTIRIFLSSFFVLFCSINTSFASHLYGGELYYTHISGNHYKVTMVLYGDCSGVATTFSQLYTATPQVQVYNGTSLYRTLYLKVLAGAGEEVTPVCAGSIGSTTCNGGTVPGVRRFAYSDTITLNVASANWKFRSTGYLTSTSSAGRSNSITNISISGSAGSLMSLEATLNNSAQPNSNPTFTTIPTPFFCINVSQEYNPGAVDVNLSDSLTYDLVDGLDPAVGTVTYLSGYSATTPLATATGTFSFSSTSGQLTFTPNLAQKSLVVCRVNEYRAGVLVGTSMREMTFIVLSSCSNRSPYGKISSLGAGTASGNTTINICKGEPLLTFNINPVDSDGNNIFMSVAGLPGTSSLSISGSGSAAPVSYFSWNTASVAAGSYYFFVTYQDDGCPLSSKQTVAYTINIAPQPSAAINIISAATCTKKAVFDIVPSGGTPAWSIKVLSGATTLHTFSGSTGSFRDSLAPGNYKLGITNSSGCYGELSFSIANPSFPVIQSFSATNPACNGEAIGSAAIVAAGSIAPYFYSIDGGSYISTGVFSSLLAGTHTIRIKDANDCTKDTTFTLTEPLPITIKASIKRPMCKPFANGAFTVTPAGGTAPYQYALGTGSFGTANTFSGLASGAYTLKVKDGNNCVREFLIPVTDSLSVDAIVSVKHVTCYGGADGQISLTPYLGRSPFSYAIGSGSFGTAPVFTSLPSGIHRVKIQDAYGCTLDTGITVAQPPALSISLSAKQPPCFGAATGSISASASGGTAPYVYSMSGAAFSGITTFPALKSGFYKITVRDAQNCTKDTTMFLDQPEGLSIALTIKEPLCFGSADGTVLVNGTGGIMPYSYARNGGTPQSDNLLTGFREGTYLITLSDKNGCTKDTNIVLNQPSKPNFDTVNITHPTCENYADGAIQVKVSGGTAPYLYKLNEGNFQDEPIFRLLKENAYTLIVRDAHDCEAQTTARLTGYPKIRLDSAAITATRCFGTTDGAFVLYTSGGNPPLRYLMEGLGDTLGRSYFTGLRSGTYTIKVIDRTSCAKDFPVSVLQPDLLQIRAQIVQNDCTGADTSGRITAIVEGGTRPYRYRWGIENNDSVLSGLANGYYALKVNDANNCTDSVNTEIRYDNCCRPSIPNAFTPNNDGRNDVIRILYKGDIELKEFSIYNRYGQQVFTTNNITQGWDGTFLGQEMELGVYYYFVRLICGNGKDHEASFKGDISLIR